MGRSLLGLVGLAATLVFALPAALLGLEFLIGGRTLLGAGLIVMAGLMIVVEEVVTTPGDLPALVAARTVDRVVDTEVTDVDDNE